MPVYEFPDPNGADEDGVVAIGGDLHPDTLLTAYRAGIFPWPIQDFEHLPWFSPDPRGILEFSKLHIPKSLRQEIKKSRFTFTIDKSFEEVITNCMQAPRGDQPGTWITDEMRKAYVKFHKLGYAHSVEVWDGDELVGGLYGVCVEGVFAGESMFSRKPNASKLALLHLIEHLKSRGAEWIDIQMVTPHMQVLGAEAVPRPEFLMKLKETQDRAKREKLVLF